MKHLRLLSLLLLAAGPLFAADVPSRPPEKGCKWEKFSNASVAVDNARAAGYLVPATKGNKQISAVGEKFVELLPDRDAAREVIRSFRPRRNKKAKED